ncbi:hypothetical protein D9613_006047 [Agrocybe pediades]|uniref:F-box domain-containing protein n=1 Tax=Agrocybe pediades TaxID=84607 RepID=A0A8H4QVQ8_9AGAR|nr:hypothetical protein D9613_006047 [Agrocybe pediades]
MTLYVIKDGTDIMAACTRTQDDRKRVKLTAPVNLEGPEEINSTKPSRGLPLEMVEIIIDCLHNNRETLASIALVCRAWVSRSRYHMFKALQVPKGQKLSKICDILTDKQCTFLSSVQELHIEASQDACRSKPSPEYMDLLGPHLPKLKSVKKLHVSALYLHMSWQAVVDTTSFTSRITELSLCSVHFASFKEWMEVLKSFQSLTTLRYGDSHGSNWSMSVFPSDIDWKLSPALRLLEIETYGMCPIQRNWSQNMWLWLRQSQVRLATLVLSSLVCIDTAIDPGEALTEFSQYLRFLGPSLKKLKMDFKDKHSISQFFNHVAMTSNTGIQEWDLSEYCLYYDEDYTMSLAYHFLTLPKLLSLLPPQVSLSRISFDLIVAPVDYESVEFFNCVDQEDGDTAWKLVDALLTSPSFPALREVVANAVMDGEHGLDSLHSLGIAKFLSQRLPRCQERGLLRCNHKQKSDRSCIRIQNLIRMS